MNRIIKFRTWQTRYREKGFMNYNPDIIHFYGEIVGTDSSDILMQFTGLIDKMHHEIYEGDIVVNKRVSDGFRDDSIIQDIREVKYIDGGFTPFIIFDKFNDIYLSDRQWEIIGNIYENPELLNK